MREIDEALLKKVQKLLALATSSNEHESNVAAQKAQELIVKYNIDLQQMNQQFEYEWHVLSDEPYLRVHQKFILPVLNSYFFVKTLLVPRVVGRTEVGARKIKTELKILGTPTNVIIADYMFNYLSETYQRLWLEYKKNNGLDEKSRQAYYHGLTKGLREKLDEARKLSEEFKAEELANSQQMSIADAKALTVVKTDLALESEFKKINTKTHRAAGFSRDSEAEAAGHEHGKKINISRPIDHKSKAPVMGITMRKS